MPELIAHTTFAYIVRKRTWDAYQLILFLFGAMLPDLLTRPFTTFFKAEQYFINASHSPLLVLLWIILMSQFFEKEIRWIFFKAVSLGAATHFLLDLVQIGSNDIGYQLLFPFSEFNFSLNLIWADEVIILAPFMTAIFLIDYFFFGKKKSLKKNKKGKRF